MATTRALYRFRFFDLVTRRWYVARYRATIETMAESHAAVQPMGAPELRAVGDGTGVTAGHLAVSPRVGGNG